MSQQESSVELASVPDRDNLVAEVWAGETEVCEISYEHGILHCLYFVGETVARRHRTLIASAERRLREMYDVPPSTPMLTTASSGAAEDTFRTATG